MSVLHPLPDDVEQLRILLDAAHAALEALAKGGCRMYLVEPHVWDIYVKDGEEPAFIILAKGHPRQ